MKKILAVAALCLINLFFPAAQAQNVCTGGALGANVFDALKELPLQNLPATQSGIQGTWIAAVETMRNAATMDGSGFCVARTGNFELFYTARQDTQTVFLVYTGTLAFPNGTWNQIGNINVTTPIFSLSLSEGPLKIPSIAPGSRLRAVFDKYYAGLAELNVDVGVQVFGRAAITGRIADKMLKPVLRMPLDKGVWLRAGQSREMPEFVGVATNTAMSQQSKDAVKGNLVNRTKAFASGANAIAAAGTDGGGASLFLEIKLPPDNSSWQGILGVNDITVSDATVYFEDNPTIRFTGNLAFASAGNKTFVTYLELPFVQGTDLPNWDKLQFGLATPPTLSLSEFTNMSLALSVETNPLGNLLGRIIGSRVRPVLANMSRLTKPLGFFVVTNPVKQVPFRAGQAIPPLNTFNMFVLGKDAKDPENVQGSLIRFKGGLRVFGQQLGNTETRLTDGRLQTTSNGSIALNLSAVGLGNPGASIRADVDLNDGGSPAGQMIKFTGNFPGKSIDFNLNETSVAINSPPTCTFPVGVTGNANIDGFNFGNLAGALKGVSVDPKGIANCLGEDLKKALAWIGNEGAALGGYGAAAAKAALGAIENPVQTLEQVGNLFKAGTWKHHPARTSYDCTNFEPNAGPEAAKFIAAYPPGRIWGSREDYDARQMNFARYIFSPVDNKFHPLMTSTVLGATQCGGLVGEEGHGYGRMNAPDKEIFDRALMCERGKFPKHLVGEPIHNASECYKWRGLQTAPRPDLWGRLVQVNGRPEWHIITQNGHLRPILANNTCGPPGAEIIRLSSLHYLYEMPLDLPPFNAEQCAASRPRTDAQKAQDEVNQKMAQNVQQNAQNTAAQMQAQIEQAQQAFINSKKGHFFFVCGDRDKHTWLVGNDGQRHYVSGARNWNNWNACNPPKEGPNCVDLATLNRFPKGADITSGAHCISLR